MKPLILLTNDDGIQSPGLAAAAQALDPLGELLIVAPYEQQTSMGRSRSQQYGSDGTIAKTAVRYKEKSWDGYSVKATPALAVVHAVYELSSRPINIVVSGINYGENVGSCVTVSGTIGAALEAAEKGIPALAVSQEIINLDPHDYSDEVDFSIAAHFTRQVAEKMLVGSLPFDADVLKLEIPCGANYDTRVVVTKQDRLMYYQPIIEDPGEMTDTTTKISYRPSKGQSTATDTDAYALAQGWVSITPLSFDLTSRVSLDKIADLLGASMPGEDK